MLRCLFSLLFSVVWLSAVGAQPKQLTPEEIRAGWILLFDGRTTYGWDGNAAVEKGLLVVGGGRDARVATLTTRFPKAELIIEARNPNQRGNETNGFQKTKSILEAGAPIRISAEPQTRIAVRSIKLRPLGTKSIFNGKNLDGWKVLPGYKSKYTVTPEGWLNVKDGRGDIQTTATYKDFLLQLECISNGKHLNSGIFFRCIPGQYQQGYEAQIRNEATPGQTRAYTLNKFDPKTHKKIGTYQVKSTAVDYGTGGIYRRMPARQGVSQDKEWFTMTVVARGNHLATWVNGIQVADWTDHRPPNANARRGCCLRPGVISIQGHDPTTDLSFRNFRIAEFPEKK